MILNKGIIREILFLTIVVTSCTNEKLGDQSIIKEGIGVDDLEIKTLTVDEIKKQLGSNYDSINHNYYSVELFYRQYGTSVYYKIESPNKVLSISFNRDFKGATEQ